MGLRFRKSISVAPGVKVNVNKKSASVTVGKKGAHYTMSTTGKQTASVGLPGTGLSYSKSFGGKKKGGKSSSTKKGTSSGNSSVGETVGNAAESAANNSGCIILAIAAVAILALIVLGIWGIVKLVSNHTGKEKASDNVSVTQTANSDSADSQSVSNEAAQSSDSELVWVTASGSKYHSKSDCGGISGATQITLEEAETLGLTPCKKCH